VPPNNGSQSDAPQAARAWSRALGVLLQDMSARGLTSPPNESGYLLGTVLIAALVVLLAAVLQVGIESGPIRPGIGSVLLGLYVLAWGLMFLVSYFYSHKTFFFRGLIWVCEHLSFPASRKMAFFYFALTLFIGGLSVLKGLALL
jgi:hypothetical protein